MAQRKDFYSWFQSETSSRGFETQWASAGAAVGVWFGGVGAVPGAIIGGFVGGLVGGFTGSNVGERSINYYHGR